MLSVQFDDSEIDVVRHALTLLKRDCNFDLETLVRKMDLDAIRHCVDAISTIDFILAKVKFL